jgi:DNA segregation ATPase FtsK/SpoIIIE-like protein
VYIEIMDNDSNPTLESLLQDMIANQHSIDSTLRDLYEKVDRIEKRLETTDVFDEPISLEELREDYYDDAKAVVREAGLASTSHLQRKLRIGYSHAATLMDKLELNGVIGPADGSKPREILDGEE